MEQIINVTTEPIELKIKVESEPLVIDIFEHELRDLMNGTLSGEFIIPDGVTVIPNSFFERTSITAAQLPDSVQTIGDSAFYYCRSLLTVNLPEGITEIPGNAFEGCSILAAPEIPSTVVSVGDRAFAQCGHLGSVVFPEGVRTLGSRLFWRCQNLLTVQLPDSLEDISGDFEARNRPTIRCHADTYAYQWATENGYTVEVIPDV